MINDGGCTSYGHPLYETLSITLMLSFLLISVEISMQFKYFLYHQHRIMDVGWWWKLVQLPVFTDDEYRRTWNHSTIKCLWWLVKWAWSNCVSAKWKLYRLCVNNLLRLQFIYHSVDQMHRRAFYRWISCQMRVDVVLDDVNRCVDAVFNVTLIIFRYLRA